MTALDIGPLDSFAEGAAITVTLEDRTLVLVRIGDDVYVLDDKCSHEDFPLSDGLVDSETCEIECSRHGALFSLETGDAVTLPATTPVRRYEVAVIDGRVQVQL